MAAWYRLSREAVLQVQEAMHVYRLVTDLAVAQEVLSHYKEVHLTCWAAQSKYPLEQEV